MQAATIKRAKPPLCPYCASEATPCTGRHLYPNQRKTWDQGYFYCDDGHSAAWVGTHKSSGKPYGTLAKKELRQARAELHAAFDPLWSLTGFTRTRSSAYRWLARQMGIPEAECHIGMFDLAQCEQASQIITTRAKSALKKRLN